MSMTYFARRGKEILVAQFHGHSVTLFTQKGREMRTMTMVEAHEIYEFEGYLGAGLRYPIDEDE